MHTHRFPSRANIVALVALIALAALGGLAYFLQQERAHEQARWQNKLDLMADTSMHNVMRWIDGQFEELTALADNASVQIYFLELSQKAPNMPSPESGYLGNLLSFTAERLGFLPPNQSVAEKADVNIQKLAAGGIALIDMQGHVLASTRGMPPLDGPLMDRIKAAPHAAPSLLDLTRANDGSISIGFLLPIYSIQSDHSAATQVGNIVAIKPVDQRFFNLLHSWGTEKTLETILVRSEGKTIRYLTPLLTAVPPMTQQTDNDGDHSAASFAVSHPGVFASHDDYRHKDVLFTSRTIQNTPWVLITKVDRIEALAASTSWQHSIIAVVVLSILVICATLVAIWRSASARRASDMSHEFQQVAAQAEARARLLSLVTENQTDALYIIDNAMNLWFANRRAAEQMNAPAEDLRGKSLVQTLGVTTAEQLKEHCENALSSGLIQATAMMRTEHGALKNLWVRFIPIESIPVVGAEYGTTGVLVVEQDVTAMMREREKRILVLNQLVAMLVSLIDRRDPHASQHSAYVARLAVATAREMDLENSMVDTIEIAAKLLNIGKMDIPSELLLRSGTLSEQERRRIRSSLKSSADLLSDIEFEGPVADTLRHAQEFMDGTGPLGLRGNEILISARVVAAANALVGMLSVRSYRDAMSYKAATDQLVSLIDLQFDRNVVFAMMNYLSNHGGQQMLASISRQSLEK